MLWPRPLSDQAGPLRSFYGSSVFTPPQKITKSACRLSGHPPIILLDDSPQNNRPPPSGEIAYGTGSIYHTNIAIRRAAAANFA